MKKLPIPEQVNIKTAYDALPSFRGGRMFLFTVTRPDSPTVPMYDTALALYSNPNSLDETYNKTKNIVPTYGGFVEFIWPDDLTTISCNASTGAFVSPEVGITGNSGMGPTSRRNSAAYIIYEDFLELFRSNAMIFDGEGKPAIRGRIMMVYDRGIYLGHFTNFEVTDSVDSPFTMSLSWTFRIESAAYRFPYQRSSISPDFDLGTPSGTLTA